MPDRELFVYWKVRRERGAQVEQAAQSFLKRLRQAHPELQCRLMRRAEAGAETLTFMETYRCTLPGGVSVDMQGDIERTAAAALGVVGAPQRHVEVFESLDPPSC